MPNATLIKRPTETRTYSVNFGNEPEIRDQGMTLTSPAVTQFLAVPISASALVITAVAVSLDLRQVIFTLSGGTDGALYTLAVGASLLLSNVSTGLNLAEYVPLQVSTTL
jgi:hypothetical protein